MQMNSDLGNVRLKVDTRKHKEGTSSRKFLSTSANGSDTWSEAGDGIARIRLQELVDLVAPAAGQAANALDAWLAHVQQVDARYPDWVLHPLQKSKLSPSRSYSPLWAVQMEEFLHMNSTICKPSREPTRENPITLVIQDERHADIRN